jgi:cell wall-associated NlpC family hydrolase
VTVGAVTRVAVVALAGAALAGCATVQRALESPEARQEREQRVAQTVAKMEAVVKQYLGVRYRLGGMDRRGVDCSGFTKRVYEAVGITLPRRAEDQYGAGRAVKTLQYGDLLFYNTKRLAPHGMCLFSVMCPTADVPWLYGLTHVGLYTGAGRMVHAAVSRGVGYADLEDGYWGPRSIGARRFLEDFD